MKSMKRNVFYQYCLQFARYIFPLVTLPYLTRVLGPEVYAVRAYAIATMSFFQVFLDYGFKAYGTREVAQSDESAEKIGKCMTCIVVLSGILCIMGFMVLLLLAQQIRIIGDNLVYIIIAYFGICLKSNLPDFIFQGLEDMGIITKRFIVSQSIACVMTIVLVKSPEQLLIVPVLETLASFIAFVWSWWDVIVVRELHFMRARFKEIIVTLKESSVFFFSSAATNIFTSLTTLMIGAFISDPDQISYWSLASTTIAAVQALYGPINTTLYPRMCITHDYFLVKRFLIVGISVVAVGCVAYWLLAEFMMSILGGEEYIDGAYLIRLVTPVIFLSYPAMLLGMPVLASSGHTPLFTASSVISAVFHVSGLFLLAVTGCFTIPAVAVLRCLTEGMLCLTRFIFAWKIALKNMS